ncbi:helicase-primase helicase subunit [Leporid alphaherpesvirus 4]|uniref:Helicase-primase helicase subunit n=1 Tax=Leporid alphaherpesvirus 4 TaxID=481315 RepID=J9QQR7_9ALPH|nr:helicase-primase helicase subunit [Leporid alphaherpesvirus 4]AFR32446.1 helicase-primase helicase subunit [Leporid alphaherpesvirus 4]
MYTPCPSVYPNSPISISRKSTVSGVGCTRAQRSATMDSGSSSEAAGPAAIPNWVFLNFTSMHGIQPILRRVRELSEMRLEEARVPCVQWFRDVAALDTPEGLPLREFPFSVYLISGNAGSGKSTCVQTLSQVLNCVVTGATRVAAQNMYMKLSTAFLSRPINTIFHEFGFRGNHVQAQLGQHPYVLSSTPATVEDLQRRDLTYYWEVISDITRRALANGAEARQEFRALEQVERARGMPPGSLTTLAHITHGGLPAFTRSNVIVIDEAGLLGRHLLTAVVYCWWMTNAIYRTPQYARRLMPVLVCVGSPTQTESLESTFEHQTLRCCVRQSENVLTYLICNRTLREYTRLPHSWAIFINNKRCSEHEFGNLMKALEYGLPITDEHMQFVDRFVVPESFITNPANLPGWTRLFSSHKEVSAYMSRLHAHLKTAGETEFTVFTLPVCTFVSIKGFEEYRKITHQPALSVEKWITANASRITNYSQSQDLDAGRIRYSTHGKHQVVVATNDVTYVLNSQVAVTARLRKLVFGFSGTFRLFESMLRDDGFVKTQGETLVELAYQFLSRLIFGGLIRFYEFLLRPGVDDAKRADAYSRMGALTTQLLALDVPQAAACPPSSEAAFDYGKLDGDAEPDDLDVAFAGIGDQGLDMFYCHYDICQADTAAAVHAQFGLLKRAFLGRYGILRDLFGDEFESAPFSTYVDNVVFRGCETIVGSMRGGLPSIALQTDSYTLVGYTYARVFSFAEEMRRRHFAPPGVAELLDEFSMPYVVLRDQNGFVSVINTNISDFVETVDSRELPMATTADYGMSSKLAMTIARSQGLSLERVAICFSPANLRLNSAYVAMSRTTSSEFLRMNLNPLREKHVRDDVISEHILAALRDPNVLIVY